jgi:hypothetical protein
VSQVVGGIIAYRTPLDRLLRFYSGFMKNAPVELAVELNIICRLLGLKSLPQSADPFLKSPTVFTLLLFLLVTSAPAASQSRAFGISKRRPDTGTRSLFNPSTSTLSSSAIRRDRCPGFEYWLWNPR